MTKEEFISKEVARIAQEGGYKVDIKLINRCWDTAVEYAKQQESSNEKKTLHKYE